MAEEHRTDYHAGLVAALKTKYDDQCEKRSEGIFEIEGGPIIFPFQIIDAVILGNEWNVLKVLVPGATEEQIIKIQKEYDQTKNDLLRQHLADVLKTAYESNESLFEKMKEGGKMGDKFNQIFEKQIQEAADKKEEKTIENMLKDNVKASNITKWTGASLEKIAAVAKKLGMSTLAL